MIVYSPWEITGSKGVSMSNALKSLINYLNNPFALLSEVKKMREQMAKNEIEDLQTRILRQDPKSLIPFGKKIYSQCDEDGIIREIFNRIGYTNKIFVEFGIGDGLENNTLSLLFENWRGLWIEASKKHVREITRGFAKTISQGHLRVINAFITKRNIDDLISSNVREKEIDLLSIDVDGNDAHIFDSINCIKPRVVVIEYNAKFFPPIDYCMAYDENHIWRSDDFFGASLKHLETLLTEKGFSLVGCNITGSNAFFVRNDLLENKFQEPYTAEKHYMPARYYLSGPFSSGHPPSYRTLENSLVTHSQDTTIQAREKDKKLGQ
jgi:hypothetical protein